MNNQLSNLVKMANQIGLFFQSQAEKEPEVAARAVAAHLNNFWAPTMRASLLDHVQDIEPGALLPIVAQALRDHAGSLRNEHAQSRSEAREVYPQGGGDAG